MKKDCLVYVTLIIGMITSFSFGQPENSNWVFGNNGRLKFMAPAYSSITFPAIQSIGTNEGSAAISDKNGNLLFSTDGIMVFDKNNGLMPNGNGLIGHQSSTQAALIVPWIGRNCRKYFIFTTINTDTSVPPANRKLHYSVVDMDLNGGLGDVVSSQKNIPLQNRIAEKLTGVVSPNGRDIWVVVHGFDETAPLTDPIHRQFFAYKVNTNGVNPTPVISTAGSPHRNLSNPTDLTAKQAAGEGQMKISPNGQWIASAVYAGTVEALRFNLNTGAVGSPIHTFNVYDTTKFKFSSVYGLEFSLTGLDLYVTTVENVPNELIRIANFSSSPVISTLWDSGSAAGFKHLGQLQLGPSANGIFM